MKVVTVKNVLHNSSSSTGPTLVLGSCSPHCHCTQKDTPDGTGGYVSLKPEPKSDSQRTKRLSVLGSQTTWVNLLMIQNHTPKLNACDCDSQRPLLLKGWGVGRLSLILILIVLILMTNHTTIMYSSASKIERIHAA